MKKDVSSLLAASGVPEEYFEADVLISSVLRIDRFRIHSYPEMTVSQDKSCEVMALARRRAMREPLAYILESAIFDGLTIKVGRGVLIPRPETEELLGIASAFMEGVRPGVFADWCTGSGCIAIALLKRFPRWKGIGADSSADALEIAFRNADALTEEGRLSFVLCGKPSLSGIAPGSLSCIIMNPPYIPSRDIPGLMPEVRDHEPAEALDGGEEGLDVIEALLSEIPPLLKGGGMVFCETAGDKQVEYLEARSFTGLIFKNSYKDYRGFRRFIAWQKQ